MTAHFKIRVSLKLVFQRLKRKEGQINSAKRVSKGCTLPNSEFATITTAHMW